MYVLHHLPQVRLANRPSPHPQDAEEPDLHAGTEEDQENEYDYYYAGEQD